MTFATIDEHVRIAPDWTRWVLSGAGNEVYMITLFYTPHTCALAPRIALNDAGADFETVIVNFAKDEQRSPEYLAINPKGRVPAIRTEQGILTETSAILLWIAQTFPEAGLAPLDDPFRLARMQGFNSYLASTVHVAHAHKRRGSRWADLPSSHEDMQRKIPETMGASFAMIENDFFEGPWVMGEQYTIADPYLFTLAGWLEGDGVDINMFPKVKAHHDRMSMLPSVQRAMADA